MTDGCTWTGACTQNAASAAFCTTQTNQGTCSGATGAVDGCNWGGGCGINNAVTNNCTTAPDQTTAFCNGATGGVADGCTWDNTSACSVCGAANTYSTAGTTNTNALCTTSANGIRLLPGAAPAG